MRETGAETSLRIVYYGVGLAGKTSNLQHVYRCTAAGDRSEMHAHTSATDRVLSFSFLARTLPPGRDGPVRVGLFTVPGAVVYDASRRTILRGVDGIVLVVGSQRPRIEQGEESAAELEANLWAAEARRLSEVPLVVQYNKRDLPTCVPTSELERRINPRGAPSFEAVATSGVGVFDTLRACVRLALASRAA